MKIRDIERQWKGHRPGIIGDPRHYAVLVPLVEQEGEARILFEVRAEGMKHQPGEVCFPGGRMEAGEDPVTCALRETAEELSIPSSAIEVIALLDRFHDHGRVIHPVLAKVDAAAARALRPSPAEVKETFLVPVDFFVQTPPHVYRLPMQVDLGDEAEDFNTMVGFPSGYPWGKRDLVVPAWPYERWVIWGLTGRVLLWTFRRDDWK